MSTVLAPCCNLTFSKPQESGPQFPLFRSLIVLPGNEVPPHQFGHVPLENKMHSGFSVQLQCRRRFFQDTAAAAEIFVCEVRMHFMRGSNVKPSTDVISGILNCVCPECGGG